MKRMLAALLTLAMLLGACACAEGVRIDVRDVRVLSGGAPLYDLTGLSARLELAMAGEESAGMRLSCSGNGQTLANVVLGMFGDALYAAYGTGDATTAAYTADSVELAANSDAALASKLDAVKQLRARLYAALTDAVEQLRAGGDWGGTTIGKLAEAVPEKWVAGRETVEYNGERCEMTRIEFDEAQTGRFLRRIAALADAEMEGKVSAGSNSLEKWLDGGGLRAKLSGGLYQGAEADYVDFTMDVEFWPNSSSAPTQAQLRFVASNTGWDGGEGFSTEISVSDGAASYGLAADLDFNWTEGESWMTPDGGATDVLEAVRSGGADALIERVRSDAQALVSAIAAGAISAMAAGQFGALQGAAR